MMLIAFWNGWKSVVKLVGFHARCYGHGTDLGTGISCPILPGIMPIQSYGGFRRMTSLCKTLVPKEIDEALEPIKVGVRDPGTDVIGKRMTIKP